MFFKKHTELSSESIEVLPSNQNLSPEQEEALSEKDLYDDHGCAIVGKRTERVVFLKHPEEDQA